MELPKNIRMRIYGFMPIITSHNPFEFDVTQVKISSNYSLVASIPPEAMLSTCRQVREEAFEVLDRRRKRVRFNLWQPRLYIHQWRGVYFVTKVIRNLDKAAWRFQRNLYEASEQATIPTGHVALKKCLRTVPDPVKREFQYVFPEPCGCLNNERINALYKANGVGCYINFWEHKMRFRAFGPRAWAFCDQTVQKTWGPCRQCHWDYEITWIEEAEWVGEWLEGEKL